jgi:hypothetical protein
VRKVVGEKVVTLTYAHGCSVSHFEHRICKHGLVCALCCDTRESRECWKTSTEYEEPEAMRPAPPPAKETGMGMSHKGPFDTYKQKFFIPDNALFRLREILRETPNARSFASKIDRDLRYDLDKATGQAMDAGPGRKFMYKRENAQGETEQIAYDISAQFEGATVIAVVGKNFKRRYDSPEWAIITVVDYRHYQALDKREKATLGDAIGPGIADLRAKIAARDTAPQAPPPAPAPARAPVPTPAPAPIRATTLPSAPSPAPMATVVKTEPLAARQLAGTTDRHPDKERNRLPPTPGPAKDTWLIRYKNLEGAHVYEETLAEDVAAYVANLVDREDIQEGTVEVFRPVKAKVKREVTVEFE